MLTLAIEASTMQPSLALFRKDARVAEREWEEAGRGGRLLFAELAALTKSAGIDLGEIDRYVCGRGPGIFSSLRMALTAAQAAALPGQAEVLAFSSGAALAWEWLMHRNAERVAIVGDARRGMCWLGIFEQGQHGPECVQDWRLAPPSELSGLAGDGTPLLSPDADRVVALWQSTQEGDAGSLRFVPAIPRARYLGEYALRRLSTGGPPEALEPLYMHPPVDPPKNVASG